MILEESMNLLESVALLGIPVTNLTLSDTVDAIAKLTDHSSATYVGTVNLDYLYNSYGQTPFRRILLQAAVLTPDGMPLIWLSRLLGSPLRERVAGADLTPELMKRLAAEGKSIFLLGPSLEVAEHAAALFKKKYPGLKVAGIACPHISGEEDGRLLEQINHAQPSLLLLSLGSPKQEFWFSNHAEKLKVPVTLGIGATLNFITGAVKRAPLWMQRSGLEWAYRLGQEPSRLWRRYLRDGCSFVFYAVPLVVTHWLVWALSFASIQKHISAKWIETPQGFELIFPSLLTQENAPHFVKELEQALQQENSVYNFQNTVFIDPYVMAVLLKTLEPERERCVGMKKRIRLLFKVHQSLLAQVQKSPRALV